MMLNFFWASKWNTQYLIWLLGQIDQLKVDREHEMQKKKIIIFQVSSAKIAIVNSGMWQLTSLAWIRKVCFDDDKTFMFRKEKHKH